MFIEEGAAERAQTLSGGERPVVNSSAGQTSRCFWPARTQVIE